MTTLDEPLWSMDDVAEYLNVPVATLRAWRSRGLGPKGLRLGRHVRFEPAIVRAYRQELSEGEAA